VRRTVPPSAEIEEQIDRLLAGELGGRDSNPRPSGYEIARTTSSQACSRITARLRCSQIGPDLSKPRQGHRGVGLPPPHHPGLHSQRPGLTHNGPPSTASLRFQARPEPGPSVS
jgi:hypothetical protein